MLEPELQKIVDQAKQHHKEWGKYLDSFKKKPPKNWQNQVLDIHEEVFSEVDCLNCANCCKTISPIFTSKDTERIAKFLRMKPSEFFDTYLRTDEDRDDVLKSSPCAFLGEDNYCSIYEVRPKACQGYPHTDQPNFSQIPALTKKNLSVCPASVKIVEKMVASLPLQKGK